MNYMIDKDPTLPKVLLVIAIIWLCTALILGGIWLMPHFHNTLLNPPVSGYELNGYIDNGYVWGCIR